jgi:hypothetical protein
MMGTRDLRFILRAFFTGGEGLAAVRIPKRRPIHNFARFMAALQIAGTARARPALLK